MKPTRSAFTKNTRRIRILESDTSDNSDDHDSSNLDSTRVEHFTRRRHQKPLSSSLSDESVHIVADRTLFNVSYSSDSESSQNVSCDDKINDDKCISSSINNSTLFELQKSNLNNYRNITQSSCSSNNSNQPKNNSLSVSVETDASSVLDEIVDESIQSSSENIDVSLLIAPKNNKNKYRKIFDSSDESDVDQTPSNNFVPKEISQILASESDDDIINSSKEITQTPIQVKHTSQIEMKLNDLSLIEPSDTDNDTSDHYLSFDQCIPLDKTDGFKSPKLTYLKTIDLPEDKLDNEVSEESTHNIKKLTTDEIGSLNMEKTRLEEILGQITKNIETLKSSVKSINLKLLPDGGLKIKKAILTEENRLKESKMQLNNVLRKLKKFSEEPIQTSSANSNFSKPFSKKAAANIDVGVMGSQALSTYRAQQVMNLDTLRRLHKSLDTCPPCNILAADPQGLKVDLMPHQKYAIAWLLWRESQKPHGGILADDMGLGKTLTMIALVLKSLETEAEIEEENLNSDDSVDNSTHNTIKGGTLIICPSSLISQWENEIKSKLRPRLLDVVQHYGPNRETSVRRLARKNIVITSYNVVMWDQKSHANTSPLFQIKWKRIILDEAHTIRNSKKQTSVAVCEISATNRWALTGTPIHNKEEDFYSLLKFIKCRPFDEWPVWKRWVGNNDDAGRNRLALLTKTLMLRRTKAELSESTSFQLPTKNVHIINVEFAKEEKEVYEKVLLFSRSLFASYLHEKAEKENAFEHGFPVNNKTKLLNQQVLNQDIFKDHPELDKLFKQLNDKQHIQAHHILVLLLRLRQICCHPCLMKNLLENENLGIDGIEDTGDLEIVDTMSRMSIGVPNVKNQPLVMSNPIFNESWVSSKIKSVCDAVREKVLNTDDKAVIVSQWPSMLLLVDKQLNKYCIKTAMFSGAIPIPKRNKLLNEFNNSKGGPKILLLSLTAGGVGLNLVAANHLFLVDIHWNPQLEAQACDRIYRVGQTKPVNVYKFICTSSIETAIQKIQSNKLEMANNVLNGYNNVEGTKITFDDLKDLFQM